MMQIVVLPFEIGNSGHSWSVMLATPETYIMRDVNRITRFTIILALVAVLVSAVIVYIALHQVTRPVNELALTLKDIAEGEGDLTHTLNVKTKG